MLFCFKDNERNLKSCESSLLCLHSLESKHFEMFSFNINWTTAALNHHPHPREFKKLRRQLQGKRHIKIELCVELSLLRLSHVDHVVHNRRSALSLA